MVGKRLSAAIVIATLTTTAASCTGDGSSYSEDDFNSGVCRQSAGSVIAIDKAVRELQGEEKTPEEVVDALTTGQTQLRAVRDEAGEAEQALTAEISALTDAIGAFRIGIDTGTAGPEQTEQVDTALQDVLDSCTTS